MCQITISFIHGVTNQYMCQSFNLDNGFLVLVGVSSFNNSTEDKKKIIYPAHTITSIIVK